MLRHILFSIFVITFVFCHSDDLLADNGKRMTLIGEYYSSRAECFLSVNDGNKTYEIERPFNGVNVDDICDREQLCEITGIVKNDVIIKVISARKPNKQEDTLKNNDDNRGELKFYDVTIRDGMTQKELGLAFRDNLKGMNFERVVYQEPLEEEEQNLLGHMTPFIVTIDGVDLYIPTRIDKNTNRPVVDGPGIYVWYKDKPDPLITKIVYDLGIYNADDNGNAKPPRKPDNNDASMFSGGFCIGEHGVFPCN